MALEVDFNAKKGMPKHFSASAINTYLRCPTQWYFRYVEWVKSPPGVAIRPLSERPCARSAATARD